MLCGATGSGGGGKEKKGERGGGDKVQRDQSSVFQLILSPFPILCFLP